MLKTLILIFCLEFLITAGDELQGGDLQRRLSNCRNRMCRRRKKNKATALRRCSISLIISEQLNVSEEFLLTRC